jgi:RNA polymerase sigma-70 factor (ECF subfamily)
MLRQERPSSIFDIHCLCLITPESGAKTGATKQKICYFRFAVLRCAIRERAYSRGRFVRVQDDSPEGVTELLVAWSEGDQSALQKLLPLAERELHYIAHRYMRHEKPGHTLQTTALVNEAYLRLVDQTRTRWRNRAHFFAIAAQIIRRILVNHARDRASAKRGGGVQQIPLDDVAVISNERASEMIALEDALELLEKLDCRKSRIVELRYFGGLSIDEIAEVLALHPDTVSREWGRAKAFLQRTLQKG